MDTFRKFLKFYPRLFVILIALSLLPALVVELCGAGYDSVKYLCIIAGVALLLWSRNTLRREVGFLIILFAWLLNLLNFGGLEISFVPYGYSIANLIFGTSVLTEYFVFWGINGSMLVLLFVNLLIAHDRKIFKGKVVKICIVLAGFFGVGLVHTAYRANQLERKTINIERTNGTRMLDWPPSETPSCKDKPGWKYYFLKSCFHVNRSGKTVTPKDILFAHASGAGYCRIYAVLPFVVYYQFERVDEKSRNSIFSNGKFFYWNENDDNLLPTFNWRWL